MVVTEEHQTDAYPDASLEDATIANERLYYAGLDSGRINKNTVAGYPNDTYTNPNNYIQQLSGSGYKIGSNVVIKVMAGDTVNIRATSWYRQAGATPGTPNSPLSSLILGLAGGLVGTDPTHYGLTQLRTPGVLDPGLSTFLGDVSNDYASHANKPKAYLNWILFDEQFHAVYTNDGRNSGFMQVGADTILTPLLVPNQVLTKSGWLFVYVSNETPNINVYFDNLQLTHMRGRILEENHYYPFGLTMAGVSSQAAGKVENRYRYNGKELQHKEFNDGSGLELYDFGARMYDVQLGRWGKVDPLCEISRRWSSYTFSYDNPMRFVDPEGMLTYDWKTGKYLDEDQNEVSSEIALQQLNTMGEQLYSSDQNIGGDENNEKYLQDETGGGKKAKESSKEKSENGNVISKENMEKIKGVLEKGDYLEVAFEYAKDAPLIHNALSIGTLTIRTQKGIITLATTAGFYEGLTKTFGKAGNAATLIEAGLDIYEYREGEISGNRLSYRLTGEAASIFTPVLYGAISGSEGGPVGALLGIAVGATFPIVENFYDKVGKPAVNSLIKGLSNYENALQSGWVPRW